MDLTNVKSKYNSINPLAMMQGAMTFVAAISIVDAIKEVPLYMAGEKNHLYARTVVALLVVICVVVAVTKLTAEGFTTLSIETDAARPMVYSAITNG
jgi:low affinity Fe/Cu permease